MAILQPIGSLAITPVSGRAQIGSLVEVSPMPGIMSKLTDANSTGLGSTSATGSLLATQAATRSILSVVNTYLLRPLTAGEMDYILQNRSRFVFTLGVGDRRGNFMGRFGIVSNWHGEDVTALRLPNPPSAPDYVFSFDFSGSEGTMRLTDNHVSVPNTYGALRYFTIRATS
ncbi:hypothetical protein PHA77_01685 [Edwardsiella tarda]|uniref:hypothetical protein n=1 Tax=Edwardsiella tarda TaxID=636 RepID=UPI0024447817|nr:hypothetical protein [Edwardsiella tarda]WGE29407.1 hypothetical protein PHA77_01685 [Edwardsiella tarda]